MMMNQEFPLHYTLDDGTKVDVYKMEPDCYEFILTRLNTETHNFFLKHGRIEESYETRFDKWQNEAVELFEKMMTEA